MTRTAPSEGETPVKRETAPPQRAAGPQNKKQPPGGCFFMGGRGGPQIWVLAFLPVFAIMSEHPILYTPY